MSCTVFTIVSLLNYYDCSYCSNYEVSKFLSLCVSETLILFCFLTDLICSFVVRHCLLSFSFSLLRAHSSERSEDDLTVEWDLSITWQISLIQLRSSDWVINFTFRESLYNLNSSVNILFKFKQISDSLLRSIDSFFKLWVSLTVSYMTLTWSNYDLKILSDDLLARDSDFLSSKMLRIKEVSNLTSESKSQVFSWS